MAPFYNGLHELQIAKFYPPRGKRLKYPWFWVLSPANPKNHRIRATTGGCPYEFRHFLAVPFAFPLLLGLLFVPFPCSIMEGASHRGVAIDAPDPGSDLSVIFISMVEEDPTRRLIVPPEFQRKLLARIGDLALVDPAQSRYLSALSHCAGGEFPEAERMLEPLLRGNGEIAGRAKKILEAIASAALMSPTTPRFQKNPAPVHLSPFKRFGLTPNQINQWIGYFLDRPGEDFCPDWDAVEPLAVGSLIERLEGREQEILKILKNYNETPPAEGGEERRYRHLVAKHRELGRCLDFLRYKFTYDSAILAPR